MAFWSSQTLEARLSELVPDAGPSAVDCNAITLTVGPEIYITPSLDANDADSHTKQSLERNSGFAIPPGQFAFLLTEELVHVPPDAMAFISIKATTKLRGLVNVSGFHVDPGWIGRLIFAVFNAGPAPVHLQRGMPLFLIWYASLDLPSAKRKTVAGPGVIPPHIISNITGAVDSIYSLDLKLKDLDKTHTDERNALSDRIHDLAKSQQSAETKLNVIGTIAVGLFLAALVAIFKMVGPTVTLPQAPPAATITPTPPPARVPVHEAPQPSK